MNNLKPGQIIVTKDQLEYAINIAKGRKLAKEMSDEVANAREDLLESLGSATDVELIDEAGREVAEVKTSVRSGGIDWKQFQKDHPDLDYESYRKPATSMTTVNIGSYAEAVAIEIILNEKSGDSEKTEDSEDRKTIEDPVD